MKLLLLFTLLGNVAAASPILNINYDLHCAESVGPFRGIMGSIVLPHQTVRFELHEKNHLVQVRLAAAGKSPTPVDLDFEPNTKCTLDRLETSFAPPPLTLEEALAEDHAPFVVARENQYSNRFTDIPLTTAHSFLPQKDRITLRYFIYFSDEDSNFKTSMEESLMAEYGRRLDIEWIYEVDFSLDYSKVLARRYQGGQFAGLGHATYEFRGAYLPNSQHPILYNIAAHNVFSDRPIFPNQKLHLVGHHLVADAKWGRINYPAARETLVFQNPWMLAASDEELAFEKKLAGSYQEYLYVLIEGKLSTGDFIAKLNFPFGLIAAKGPVRGLGDGLWGRQSYTAVPLSREGWEHLSTKKGGARFFLTGETDLTIENLKFYSLRENLVDISSHFQCTKLAGMKTECLF